MKIRARSLLTRLFLAASLLFSVSLLLISGAFAKAQENSPAAVSPTGAPVSPVEKPDAARDNDEFRHAPIVKAMAGMIHMSTEATAQIFEDINSLILIGLILYFVVKVLPKAFRSRSETIQNQLAEARAATEAANQRLAAVEAKLGRLGEDIDQIRRQTESDLLEDEKRIKQSIEEERARIVKSAEVEIESAGAAAQRELKRFAAGLAIDKAVQRIQLSPESDKALIERFGKDLVSQFGKREQN